MGDDSDLPAPFTRRIRLLLIEDEAAEAKRLQEMLACSDGLDFETRVVACLEEALQVLQDSSYDVVLLDLSLPEGAGLDVYLRAKVAAASVPIVVMTAEHEDFLASQALRLGAQDYLAKCGLTTSVVSRTLRHAVERHYMFRDLTMAREREHFLANHDSLTQLPNRYSFQDHLGRALAYAQRSSQGLAVLFIDLDGFKAINDSLGHGSGDELLRKVAQRLAGSMRRSDVLARVGGDEFILTVPDVDDLHGTATVAEKVLSALGDPFRLGVSECWITASVGVACYPRDGADAETLIRNADLAMYHAKADGRNRYRFYREGMNAAAAEHFDRVSSLRRAIVRDELVLHFQPQVDAGLRAVVGAEALIRWQHPTLGLVAPSEFVPLAEETGVVVPMGEWALRRACEAALGWPPGSQGPLTVGVNVSTRQLTRSGFADTVAAALRDTGLPPGRLELEVTETSVLEHGAAHRNRLAELRCLGVRIATDDFGTGSASLSLLKELPVDRLKVDQALVRGATPDSVEEIVAGALIQLARRLGITAVGEGVETEEQLRFLWQQGCHQMQGYLFAKPMPAADFAAFLADPEPTWEAVLERALD